MNKLLFFVILIMVAIIVILPFSLAGCGEGGFHLGQLMDGGGNCGSGMAEFHIYKFRTLYAAVFQEINLLAIIFIWLVFWNIKISNIKEENIFWQLIKNIQKCVPHIKFFEPIFQALSRGLINKKHLN